MLSACGGGGGSGSSASGSSTTESPASITQQPVGVTVNEGDTISLSFNYSYSGFFIPTITWYKDGKVILVANSKVLSIPISSTNDAGKYYAEVNIAFQAKVQTNSVDVVVNAKPASPSATISSRSIPSELSSGSGEVAVGYNVKIAMDVQGYPSPTLQWYFNDQILPGQTSATLEIQAATAQNQGAYHLVATNSQGSITSTKTTLTVVNQRATGFWTGTITPTTPTGGGAQPAHLLVMPSGEFVMMRFGDDTLAKDEYGVYTGTIKTSTFYGMSEYLNFQTGKSLSTIFTNSNSNPKTGIREARFTTNAGFSYKNSITSQDLTHYTLNSATSLEKSNLSLSYNLATSSTPVALSDLAGTWTVKNGTQISYQLKINADGSIDENNSFDAGGCSLSGALSTVPQSAVFFNAAVTPKVKLPTCTSAPLAYSGYAVQTFVNGTKALAIYIYTLSENRIIAFQYLPFTK
jgi:hypothetical protein